MALLIQLQGGNYFRGNTGDKEMRNGETGSSFLFQNLAWRQLCVLPPAKKKDDYRKKTVHLNKSGFFSFSKLA